MRFSPKPTALNALPAKRLYASVMYSATGGHHDLDAKPDDSKTNGGNNPMDVRTGRPCVPEEATCKAEERRKDRRRETTFWEWYVIVATSRTLVEGILSKRWWYPKKKTCKDGQLEKADGAKESQLPSSLDNLASSNLVTNPH